MPVQALQCKECDATYPRDARYVCEHCFGPLEVVYDHSGIDAAEAKRKIQAGPQTIWRYADFLPFSGPPAAGLPVGLTPLRLKQQTPDLLREQLQMRCLSPPHPQSALPLHAGAAPAATSRTRPRRFRPPRKGG